MSWVFLLAEKTIAFKMYLLKAFLLIPEVLLDTDFMMSSTLGMLKMQLSSFLVHPQEALRISSTLPGSPVDVLDLLLLSL